MSDSNHLHAVMLGALLHDIGKVVQRADQKPRKQDHCKFGDEWFVKHFSEKISGMFTNEQKEIIRSAINNHHYSEKYIKLADEISAGMERMSLEDEETKGNPNEDRLISIFTRILNKDKGRCQYYALNPLDQIENEIFPENINKCREREYESLLNGFNDEIKNLDFREYSSSQVIETIESLLMKFFWCVPGDAYGSIPDISLFDHLKTSSAIAGCLFEYQNQTGTYPTIEDKAFSLIGGDVSGIQNYIMDAVNQTKSAAKRLRARSFYIQMMSEIACHRILHEFRLLSTNILISAGGNFTILVPNIRVEEVIQKLQKEFDEWCLKYLKGEAFVTLASITCTGRDLKSYKELYEELKESLLLKKQRPLRSVFQGKKNWDESRFFINEIVEGDQKACRICGRHPREEEKELCRFCFCDTELGKGLTKADYLAFYEDSEKGMNSILGYGFDVFSERNLKTILGKNPYRVFSLNSLEVDNGITGFRLMANHVPSQNGEVLTFNEIVGEGEGTRLLGYVKGDADNMGKIFREGFENPSISRICSLSRMIDLYFSGYLQKRIEKEYAKELYVVYSGGDDFFIIGKWDRLLDFVKKLRERFTRYCGENPCFTFSTGLYFCKDHDPLSMASELVEKELEKAKKREGKDCLTFLGKVLSWAELDRVLIQGDKMMKWLRNNLISRGFVHNLWKYGGMAEKYFSEGKKDTRLLKFIPLITYDINRNLTKFDQNEVKEWIQRDVLPNTDFVDGGRDLSLLRILSEYVLAKTRGGEE